MRSTAYELFWTGIFLVLGLAVGRQRAAAADPKPEYIADGLSELILSAEQSWGSLGLNTATRPKDRPARPLRIKDRNYDRGLGQHANGKILIGLDGRFKTFEAEVGIQWHGGTGTSSVIFQVFVDGQKRFDSGIMREGDPPRAVSVSVQGADDLLLVADDAGDGITGDVANWADARLIRDPSVPRDTPPARVDVAPFASVVTSDPGRTSGTKSTRVQEFPAEDLFLETELLPDAGGVYTVPTRGDGLGCIGLVWHEARFLRTVGLEFADASGVPEGEGVRLQYWAGTSFWQGAWKPLEAKLAKTQARWTWQLSKAPYRLATRKVRWILPAAKKPIRVRGLSAYTSSRWRTADIRIECRGAAADKQGRIELYNGVVLNPPTGASPFTAPWNPAEPLCLTVRYARTGRCKTDRTVLRFQLPGTAFGVAVEDVMTNPCVYLPHTGVFVTRNPAPLTLEEYLKKIAGQKTVLDRVREMPEQTFAVAMEKVHNPIQDLGPMMISLACDERKFIVHREGAVEFRLYDQASRVFDGNTHRGGRRNLPCRLRPQFGGGENEKITRRLDGGWLPMPVTTVCDDGIVYRQRTYVAPVDDKPAPGAADWLRHRAVCIAEYTVENTTGKEADALLTLNLTDNVKKKQLAQTRDVAEGVVATSGGRLLALIDTTGAKPLAVKSEPGKVFLVGRLPPGRTARCTVYMPAWNVDPKECGLFLGKSNWAGRVEAYWKDLMAPAMQIDLPDELLTNVIRASQVHCMLAAGNEEQGRRIDVWTSADRYGALESESQPVIRGMDMTGNTDFARRGLEFFIKRYNAQGYLTTGYTMMGTGWHLWTLAEHFDRTQDRAWLRRIAPEVAHVCRWIVRQREKTRRLDARGRKIPQHGLTPPGVIADWPRFTNSTFQAAHYCAGLREAARVLGQINHPDAPTLAQEAIEYREDILRAYRWTQARTPAVPLADGTWVPAYPPIFFVFGEVGGFFPGEDGSRAWCKNAMAHHLVAGGLIDPKSEEVGRMLDHMEDVEFLRTGLGDYPGEENRRNWFHRGGFNKCQPYYRRNVEIYALRDEVKPFLRSYFNTIPSLLSRENLSFWEHFHNRGGWNKTHETGWFLCQSRIMLVMERGNDLWLAPFLSRTWLADGNRVAVSRAPTRFGPVGYTITSKTDSGQIEAVIDPPTRSVPERIVLRVRHPNGKPIRSVTVQGKPHEDFDPSQECVRIKPAVAPVSVCVRF